MENKEAYYLLYNKNKKGIQNSRNEVIVPAEYDDVKIVETNKTFFIVRHRRFFGVYDESGKLIVPVRFFRVSINNAGNITVKRCKKVGLYDSEGNVVIPI